MEAALRQVFLLDEEKHTSGIHKYCGTSEADEWLLILKVGRAILMESILRESLDAHKQHNCCRQHPQQQGR